MRFDDARLKMSQNYASSRRAIATHLRSLAVKLDARNRTEVVIKALKAGLL